MDPDSGRIDGRDPFQESARNRFPLPALDAGLELHVARQFNCNSRCQARPCDATHSDTADHATHFPQAEFEVTDLATPLNEATLNGSLTGGSARTHVSHQQMANAIRFLAVDAVDKANSGHPGMPMGMADVATVLFTRFLKFDPSDPAWPDRDRFVLSAGHGSMLLYALLYLAGYAGVTLEEIRSFRQWGSKTPGHPEYGHTPGVETTTGPLGQGIATAVGMALAERMANARHGDELVDHFTYVIAGDGCLMEGISHEAISLAGHLKLGKLIVLFDDNQISIDGATSLSCSDNQLARFAASNWSVRRIDGHDPAAIATAIGEERETDRPSLIACRTLIGYGSPARQGTEKAHGNPLGREETAATRTKLNWSFPPFEVPDAILSAWRDVGARGRGAHQAWQDRRKNLSSSRREGFDAALSGMLPGTYERALDELRTRFAADRPDIATRQASQQVLQGIVPALPSLVGGSADLTHSNLTLASQTSVTAKSFRGAYVHYGVREHGMAAAMNGIALHGGFVPYGGTFLAFADYSRPAIRLAALMGVRVIHVMTHDSIGLGEDGPTHQPVEQLASLRAIPNLLVFRPADAIETLEAWDCAIRSERRPSILCLSRQAEDRWTTLRSYRTVPGLQRLDRIGRSENEEIGDRAKRCELLDRLMRRSILAQTDGIMRHHMDHAHSHQCREPDGGPTIVGESQESSAVGDETSVQCDAVHSRRHAVFTDAVMHVCATEGFRCNGCLRGERKI